MTYRSARCPICKMTVIVWKRKNLDAGLLRSLAVADHVKTLHGIA